MFHSYSIVTLGPKVVVVDVESFPPKKSCGFFPISVMTFFRNNKKTHRIRVIHGDTWVFVISYLPEFYFVSCVYLFFLCVDIAMELTKYLCVGLFLLFRLVSVSSVFFASFCFVLGISCHAPGVFFTCALWHMGVSGSCELLCLYFP